MKVSKIFCRPNIIALFSVDIKCKFLSAVIDDEASTVFTAGAIVTVTCVLKRQNLSEVFGDETYKDKNIVESDEKDRKEKDQNENTEADKENKEKSENEQQQNKVR